MLYHAQSTDTKTITIERLFVLEWFSSLFHRFASFTVMYY